MTDGLDPGVRRLVTLLQERGFTTTDSGDGVSKPAEARSFGDMPHVCIRSGSGVEAIEDARRLVEVLATAGVSRDQIPQLQATWSPLDGIAMVLLLGVTDADLGGES